jgi:hypothetical protein
MKNEKNPSVDDLKEKMKGKYIKFVEKSQYYSYWRNKRSEPLSWINNQVEENITIPDIDIFRILPTLSEIWHTISHKINVGDKEESLKNWCIMEY